MDNERPLAVSKTLERTQTSRPTQAGKQNLVCGPVNVEGSVPIPTNTQTCTQHTLELTKVPVMDIVERKRDHHLRINKRKTAYRHETMAAELAAISDHYFGDDSQEYEPIRESGLLSIVSK